MKLVRQPNGSNLCGQACCATICGITLDKACKDAGTVGKTFTRDLKHVLHTNGLATAPRRVRSWPKKDETALLFFQSEDRKEAHWVVWHKGKFYDPAAGVFRRVPGHLADADMTSHL